MEKTIKLSSSSLSVLNEALQRLTLNDTVKSFTPVIVEANGKFTSVIKPAEEFDPNAVGTAIEAEELESEEKKEDRQKLINKAKDALKQSLENSKELDEILQKIKKLSEDEDYNQWQLNQEGNTAILRSKNAYIFKQNNNLCLSHSGKIELFHSVEELHKWLEENNYPLPKTNIIIHEAVDTKGKETRNWYDLVKAHQDGLKANYQPAPSNKPEVNDDFAGLSKAISDKEYRDAYDTMKKAEKEECFGGACVSTAALGPAVAYTATPKVKKSEKKEDSLLTEAKDSFIPGDNRTFPGWGKALNAFLSWAGKNWEEIEAGHVKFPANFDTTFEKIIKPTFFAYNCSDIASPIWNETARNLARDMAKEILHKKGIKEDNPNWDELEVAIGTDILKNPTQGYLNLLEKNLNNYGTKVKLVPGYPVISTEDKTNPNYLQRKEWEPAALEHLYNKDETQYTPRKIKNFKALENLVTKNTSKTSSDDPETKVSSVLDKFTPEEQKLLRSKKIDVNDYTEDELRGIVKLFTKKKSESTIFESAKSYPWLNKVLGQRLTEDDTPADFATGQPVIDQLNSVGNNSSTTDTTDTTTDNVDFDIPAGSSSTDKKNFGDINISTDGNYSPEDLEIPEEVPGAPNYKIVDVLANEEDPSDIKVKIQNTDTDKVEVKDLSEIDV